MMAAFEAFRQRDVGFGDAADARMQDARGDFVGAELLQRAENGFQRALHVGLDDQREFLAARGLELRTSSARASRACR